MAPFSRTHAAFLAAARAGHLAQVAAQRQVTAAATGPSAAYQTARAGLARGHRADR